MPASWASGGSLDSRACSTASTATADATSPAFAPPMPSATANSGGLTTSESSFAVRWRPTSVRPACSTMRSATRLLLVAVFAVADPDGVGRAQALRAPHLAAVQVGAVRGAEVLDVHEAAPLEDARVRGGREGVLHAYVRPVRAAEGRAVSHVEGRTRLVAHRGNHLEARRQTRANVGGPAVADRRPGNLHRLRGGRRPAVAREVPHGAPHHPEKEEIEDGKEAELQRDGERLVHALVELEGQVRHADRDRVAWTERLLLDPAAVHLDPVRRAQVHDLPAVLVATQLGMPPRDVRVLDHDVGLTAAAEDDPAAAEDVTPAAAHEQRLAAVLVRRLEPPCLTARRIHHRVPEVAGRRGGRLCALGLAGLLRRGKELRL